MRQTLAGVSIRRIRARSKSMCVHFRQSKADGGKSRPVAARDRSPTDSSLMRVVVERGATWTAGTPARVLDRAVPFISTYA
jgi:hypothetical protein